MFALDIRSDYNFECKCEPYNPGTDGNCESKYQGQRWCYLQEGWTKDNIVGCGNVTPSKRRPGSYWSTTPCRGDPQAAAVASALTHSTGTSGIFNFFQGKQLYFEASCELLI